MKKIICFLMILTYLVPIKILAQGVNGGSRRSDNLSSRLKTHDDDLESRLKIDTNAYQERKNNGVPSSSKRSSSSTSNIKHRTYYPGSCMTMSQNVAPIVSDSSGDPEVVVKFEDNVPISATCNGKYWDLDYYIGCPVNRSKFR